MRFIIKEKEIPLGNISYHYKEAIKKPNRYCLELCLDDIQGIRILEKFAGELITSKDFLKQILLKDKENGSLGLIWNILIAYEDLENEDKTLPYYMLNSLEDIFFEKDKLVLFGFYED